MAEEAVKRAGTKITLKYFGLEGGSVAKEISANIKKIAFQSTVIEKQSRVWSLASGSWSLLSGVLGESIICPNHFVAPNRVYDSPV